MIVDPITLGIFSLSFALQIATWLTNRKTIAVQQKTIAIYRERLGLS